MIFTAQAEREEAEDSVEALRTRVKAVLMANDDSTADELITRLTRAQDKAKDISYEWTRKELSLCNETARSEDRIREAHEALTLAQQLGGQPETYEEIFQAFDVAIGSGQGMIVDIDDGGRTELSHDELAEFKDEIQMGEGISVLALTR
ncbi:hypothetical protein EDL96_13220 [Kocuria soli]|uniref:Uncharacterized protein n=1 Tax=Kocuria soli TaxID=2485125 RepID=A0A3N3ZQD4_9MICC|nr:hypothetical protein EDL96_13220 [Kocuria soli]